MKTPKLHYASFFGILFFAASALFFFLLSATIGISTLLSSFFDGQIDTQATIIFITQGFVGALLGVAALISLFRFMNKPYAEGKVSTSVKSLHTFIGVIGLGAVLFIGNIIQANQSINWLALPFLTIPATTLPIWLILRIGIKDLYLGSRWRTWSTFGLSMSFTIFLIFMFEIMVIIFILVLFIIYAAANPQLSLALQSLSNQFANIAPESEEAIKLLMPYLTKPGVIVILISFFSFIVPLLEEAFKPFALWILAGKITTRAQGFSLGALCGAGFAFVETINVSIQVDGWAELLFARIGTGAMHITASALIGAAIVSAFQDRRYLQLLGTYLLSVLLHGTWNAVALTNGFSTILAFGQPDRAQTLFTASSIALVVLTLGSIIILIISNHFYRKIGDVETSKTIPDIEDHQTM